MRISIPTPRARSVGMEFGVEIIIFRSYCIGYARKKYRVLEEKKKETKRKKYRKESGKSIIRIYGGRVVGGKPRSFVVLLLLMLRGFVYVYGFFFMF